MTVFPPPQANPMADDTSTKPLDGKCRAKARSGKPCKQPAIPGGHVCRYHGGAAPQVQRVAQRRVVMESARKSLLAALGTVEVLDDPVLALRSLAGRLDAVVSIVEEKVTEVGMTTVDDLGVARIRPEMEVWLRVTDQFRRVATDLGKLGFTPESAMASLDLANHPEFTEVRDVILEAVRPFPDAFSAMLDALEDWSQRRSA